MIRHRDFERIYNEFIHYYKDKLKGESEYYSWLKTLSLDESREYGAAKESFQWAKDMLKYLREDTENKYYSVLVGFPIASMNGNVYHERDLIAAATNIKGKHPSLNHKNEFHFSPNNPRNHWGILPIVDAKYEDGAVEAILQVPKTAICPVCNGKKMIELIDSGKIVNVSLEGSCASGYGGNCEGFTFSDPPFTLLTSDVLPGMPLARIKPLEHIMVEALQVSTKNIGEKKMTIKPKIIETDAKQTQPDTTVNTKSNVDPDFKGTFGTPIDADAKLHDYTMSSGNTTVEVGESPANKVFTSGKAEAKVNEPFADYKDFDDCVAKNSDKEDPQAYCGSIKAKTEANKPPERTIPEAGALPPPVKAQVMQGTTPVADNQVWTGTSPVGESKELTAETVRRIKAEYTAQGLQKNLEYVEAIWIDKYSKLAEENKQLSTKNTQKDTIIEELRKNKIDAEAKLNEFRDTHAKDLQETKIELEDYKGRYGSATREASKFNTLAENLQIDNETLKTKYHGALVENLKFSRDCTKANEDYLEVAKKLEKTEEALTRSRNEAKKILKIQA